jgi:hypothetical protein
MSGRELYVSNRPAARLAGLNRKRRGRGHRWLPVEGYQATYSCPNCGWFKLGRRGEDRIRHRYYRTEQAMLRRRPEHREPICGASR